MSGFLQKLKSGGVAVDNHAQPDSHGAMTRKVEKRFANDPASTLGLELSNDAEVLGVEPGSPAAHANIPPGSMIYEVNNEFIENSAQFDAAAGNSLVLVIKLQTLSSVSELIAKILREEESASMDEARKKINLDELSRTTPRYSFLSSDHPIFRRYASRLRIRRETTALMRQREREAEERIERENRERIQKVLEQAQAEAKAAEERARRDEEACRAAVQKVTDPLPAPENQQVSFIPVFEDTSTFGHNPEEPAPEEKKPEPAPAPASIPDEIIPASRDELLALLGASPTDLAGVSPLPPVDGSMPSILGEADVRYVVLPSEEYVLRSGETVICSLKARSGPPAVPPPGKPPKISREAREILKRKREHSEPSHLLPSSSDDDELQSRRDKCERTPKRSRREYSRHRHRDNSRERRRHRDDSRDDRHRRSSRRDRRDRRSRH